MPKFLTSIVSATCLVLLSVMPAGAVAAKSASQKFSEPVRIAFVPQRAFMVDNGVVSGSLAPLMECSTSYFSNIEFVEMSSYGMLMRSLEGNVVDIGLNMVRSESRDKLAVYGMDLYQSRILLVNDGADDNNKGAGILAVRQGSDIDQLLLAKGYAVNTKAYSIDRLIEMYRSDVINSFAEMELSVFEELKTMDVNGVDYDYEVLAELAGGSYLSKTFAEKHPEVLAKWKKIAQSCAYLVPKIDG